MALFCQLPISLISCDGFHPLDLCLRLAFGAGVGLTGAALGVRWSCGHPRSTKRRLAAYMLPASSTAYAAAMALDFAGRALSRKRVGTGSTSDIVGLDRAAGAFAALSFLAYTLYLSTTTSHLLFKNSVAFVPTSLTTITRTTLLTLLSLTSLVATTLSVVSQTTLSFGYPNPTSSIQAGFITQSSLDTYDKTIQVQLAAVLVVMASTLVAVVWRAGKDALWDASAIEGEIRSSVLFLWGNAVVLGIVRVTLVFEGLTSDRLEVRRAMLFVEYGLLCGAEFIQTLPTAASHLSLPEWRATPTPLIISQPRWNRPITALRLRPSPPSRPPRSILRPSLAALDLRPRFARTSWTSTNRPIAYQTSIDHSREGSIRTQSSYSADSDETILPTSIHHNVGIDETLPPTALRHTRIEPSSPPAIISPPTPPRKFLRHVSDNSLAPEPIKGPLVQQQPLAFHPFRTALPHTSSPPRRASVGTVTASVINSSSVNFREQSPSPPSLSDENDEVVEVRTGSVGAVVASPTIVWASEQVGLALSVVEESDGAQGGRLCRSGTGGSRATASSVEVDPFQYEWVGMNR